MASRAVDIINTGPSFTQADADALNARFAGVDSATMLKELLAEGSLGRVAVVFRQCGLRNQLIAAKYFTRVR